jgi:hypothetical protein
MVDYLARPVVHEAFFKKYASKRFLKGNNYHLLTTLLVLTDFSINSDQKMGEEVRGRSWH